MNDKTCKCDNCHVEIPANLGMKETRIYRATMTTYTVDLCEKCWFDNGDDEVDSE